MKKIRFRRAYTYNCKTCHQKRKTLMFPRFIKGVCMKCKRSAIVAGQKPLFDQMEQGREDHQVK